MHNSWKYPNQTRGRQLETHRPPNRFRCLFRALYLVGQTNVPAPRSNTQQRIVHSNEGDLSPHTSHMVYFSNTNENKSSARESLYKVDIVIEPMCLASKGAIYVKLQH